MNSLKENLFDILGLPVSFRLAQSNIRKNYYRLSRDFHPDHFAAQSDEAKTRAILKSELINLAYKVLSDENQLIKHILEIYGMLDDSENVVLEQHFLMEMMEVNESIEEMDLSDSNNLKMANEMIDIRENDFRTEVNPWIEAFENGERSREVLAKIREYYLKTRYLLRIRENMGTFASGN